MTCLMRSLGAIHKRAIRDGDDWSIEKVEEIAADVLSGNGIPYRNVRLMLASYWPLELC